MQPVPTYETVPVAFSSATQVAIPSPTIDSGYAAGVTLPTEHFSWLEYKVTKKIDQLAATVTSLITEMDNYLTSRSVTPSGSTYNQFLTALASQIANASVASAATATTAGTCTGNSLTATTATNALACSGNSASATVSSRCSGHGKFIESGYGGDIYTAISPLIPNVGDWIPAVGKISFGSADRNIVGISRTASTEITIHTVFATGSSYFDSTLAISSGSTSTYTMSMVY